MKNTLIDPVISNELDFNGADKEILFSNSANFGIKFVISFIGYPDSTPITRVIDGGEPPEFRSLFRKWTDKYQTKSFTYQRKHCELRLKKILISI